MTVKEEKILQQLKNELNAYKLGIEVAKAYGCTPQYVSMVLNQRTPYNPRLVETATSILDQFKENYNKHLVSTSKKLGLR